MLMSGLRLCRGWKNNLWIVHFQLSADALKPRLSRVEASKDPRIQFLEFLFVLKLVLYTRIKIPHEVCVGGSVYV